MHPSCDSTCALTPPVPGPHSRASNSGVVALLPLIWKPCVETVAMCLIHVQRGKSQPWIQQVSHTPLRGTQATVIWITCDKGLQCGEDLRSPLQSIRDVLAASALDPQDLTTIHVLNKVGLALAAADGGIVLSSCLHLCWHLAPDKCSCQMWLVSVSTAYCTMLR